MADDLTTGSVARALGRSEGTVRNMVRRGELPAVRLASGLHIFRRVDVDRACAARHAQRETQ